MNNLSEHNWKKLLVAALLLTVLFNSLINVHSWFDRRALHQELEEKEQQVQMQQGMLSSRARIQAMLVRASKEQRFLTKQEAAEAESLFEAAQYPQDAAR